MDRLTIEELLVRSSLGSPQARRVRRRTPAGLADRLLEQILATDLQRGHIGVQQQPRSRGGSKMSSDKDRHVVPNPGGGWDVKKGGAERSSGHRPTQKDAIDRAREIVRNGGGGEVVIHGRDGRIRDKDTVAPGNDPNPPRDKR